MKRIRVTEQVLIVCVYMHCRWKKGGWCWNNS